MTSVKSRNYNKNMSKVKENRNKEIVEKKVNGWSYRKLAEHFNISAPRIVEIYQENKGKFGKVKGVDKRGLDAGVRGVKIKSSR